MQKYLSRAKRVIPGGLFGHFQFPHILSPDIFPCFAKKGKGCRFIDINNKEYIDYISSFGCNLLGYAFDEIEDFILVNKTDGNSLSLPKYNYVELAELFTKTVSTAEWVVFAKNGSDVTSLAVIAARAHTKKKKIVAISNGFHGSHHNWGWCNPGAGRYDEDYQLTILTEWNNSLKIESIFREYGSNIAAIIFSPLYQPVYADTKEPKDEFIHTIHKLCKEYNVLIICDEVRTGFHIINEGTDKYFGIESDLVCYSKALGNTYSISALGGKRTLYDTMKTIFYSGTFWAEENPILAAIATLKFLNKNAVTDKLEETGKMLCSGIINLSDIYSVPVKVTGPSSMPYVRFLDDAENTCDKGVNFASFLCDHGIYVHSFHNWSITYSHEKKDIAKTLEIIELAFKLFSKGQL